jgi:hypothetical protein
MHTEPDYDDAPCFEKIRRKPHERVSKDGKEMNRRWERKRTDWSKTKNRHDHDLI